MVRIRRGIGVPENDAMAAAISHKLWIPSLKGSAATGEA